MSVIQTAQRNKAGEKKATRFYSSKQEKSVAKNLNGKVNKNSGATLLEKGDVQLDNWLIECKTKTTDSDSISIKKDWIEKTIKESVMMGKDNVALIFSFGPSSKNYVIIEENTFKDLINNKNNG
jgi:hypothetical protein